jgi:hypothetical protein
MDGTLLMAEFGQSVTRIVDAFRAAARRLSDAELEQQFLTEYPELVYISRAEEADQCYSSSNARRDFWVNVLRDELISRGLWDRVWSVVGKEPPP